MSWFYELSKAQQSAYLKKHPNSKYAKRSKSSKKRSSRAGRNTGRPALTEESYNRFKKLEKLNRIANKMHEHRTPHERKFLENYMK